MWRPIRHSLGRRRRQFGVASRRVIPLSLALSHEGRGDSRHPVILNSTMPTFLLDGHSVSRLDATGQGAAQAPTSLALFP